LPQIIREFMMRPDIGGGVVEQPIYIFKTHGGRFTTDAKRRPNLFDRELPQNSSHVLLFDTHDEKGEIFSELKSYFWTKENGCELYRAKNRKDLSVEEHCKETALAATSGVGNGTSGVGNGTSGVGNGTSGVGNGTSGVGNGTSGVGNGTSGVGNGTSGVGNGTSGAGNGTAGAGKGTLFTGELLKFDGLKDELKPDGVLRMGEAASYDTDPKKVKGVYQFFLSPGVKNFPILVMLDSCYGSELISNSMRSTFREYRAYFGNMIGKYFSAFKVEDYKVVVLRNPAPLYYRLIDYSILRGDHYLMLPSLMTWALDDKHPQHEVGQRLLDHWKNGFDACKDEKDSNSAYCKAFVSIVNIK
jgi:hypothetical protein